MHINGQLDDLQYFKVFFPGRILSQRRILYSAYSLHYYLHSVVAMIAFWRILSWEDFVPGGFCPLPMQLIGQLDYLWHFRVFFFPRRILSRRRILSSAFILHYYLYSVVVMIVFWRILSQGGFYPREDFVPYPCTPLLCNNCILEDFEPRKILSREDFVLCLCPLLWSTFRLSQ